MMPAASKPPRLAVLELEQVPEPEQVLELEQVPEPEQVLELEQVLVPHIRPPTDRPALYRQQSIKLLFSSFFPPSWLGYVSNF